MRRNFIDMLYVLCYLTRSWRGCCSVSIDHFIWDRELTISIQLLGAYPPLLRPCFTLKSGNSCFFFLSFFLSFFPSFFLSFCLSFLPSFPPVICNGFNFSIRWLVPSVLCLINYLLHHQLLLFDIILYIQIACLSQ